MLGPVRIFAIATLLACTVLSPLRGQSPAPPTAQVRDLEIPRLTTRPKLDEFLHGASRADMKRVDDFRQQNPGDGTPVSLRTTAFLGYDDNNFYAVFVCESPAGQTRARMSPIVKGVKKETYIVIALNIFAPRHPGVDD